MFVWRSFDLANLRTIADILRLPKHIKIVCFPWHTKRTSMPCGWFLICFSKFLFSFLREICSRLKPPSIFLHLTSRHTNRKLQYFSLARFRSYSVTLKNHLFCKFDSSRNASHEEGNRHTRQIILILTIELWRRKS